MANNVTDTGGNSDLLIDIGANIGGFVTALDSALSEMGGFASAIDSLPLPDIFQPLIDKIDAGEQWITNTGTPAFAAAMQAMADTVPTAFASVTAAIVGPIRDAVGQINGLISGIGNIPVTTGGQPTSTNALPTFASGGFTGDGLTDSAAGIVHRGEYVVPQNGALVMRDSGGIDGSGQTIHISGPISVYGVQDAAALLDSILKEAKRQNKVITGG